VASSRAPVNTYRLQISSALDLYAATRRLQYLHDLGVDWVYLSPLLTAEPGSNHGYDVVSHEGIDPSRGGPEGLAALSAEARRLGMGVLVDIVPNHVGVATPRDNAWWWDLLKHGRESSYADTFDVDWDTGGGRIRIPVLGDDADLANDLHVEGDELHYFDNAYPIAPGTASGCAVEVHDRQHYELVSWRVADHGLNYRRFFAVNTLAAVRVEDPAVFEATHAEIKRWFDEELVDGLRVDHPDGLRDPEGYLDDLAELTGGAYVLVEKILEPGEELPRSWATAGTTGYDALAWVDRVLTDPAGRQPLDELESRLRGGPVDWHQMTHDTKRAVADGILGSEVRRIVRAVVEEGAQRLSRDRASDTETEPPSLVDAVAELLACFPVYRSYLPEGREHLDQAFALARKQRPDLADQLDALEPVLADPEQPAAKRFQQTSGMVMAKGVEDCAFYRYSRLTSLNEVGGDPSVFAMSVEDFHAAMEKRQAEWPQAMTAGTTHDTKRGEDVRARIGVLAELPQVWATHLDQLLTLVPMPDPGFASLLWQAILGAWPAEPHPDLRARLHGYAEKAMREAGDHTTWTEQDAAYEAAVHRAVDAALDEEPVRRVLAELLAHVAGPGWSNALSAKLVSITMPGVPDVYQGSELWEQSLVDPDNRRPVLFDRRMDLLGAVRDGAGAPLRPDEDDPGVVKLLVAHRALSLRRDRRELFGSYDAVSASGPAADHVLAFDRGGAVTVATRLPVGLAARGGWADTTLQLPRGTWLDAISGRRIAADEDGVRMADVLERYPVALLVLEGDR
jgi:(1->4)-alpha-D-glucan 1-alpha-D-glucosylmutase